MRIILYIIQKEFIQIVRNKMMLPIMFVIPLVQLIILVNAATMEMKHINFCVVDKDISSTSRLLADKFKGSPFFILKGSSFSMEEAESELLRDRIDIIINIPAKFEQNIVRDGKAKIQLIVNAINGTSAGIIYAYTSLILADYNQSVITRWMGVTSKGPSQLKSISAISSFWYNPQLNYKNFMVPALMVMLTTIIGMFLSSMNLVREKELGTIEQINVTPIKKYQFIAGKLIPFWIIGLLELAFGLSLGKLLFDIPMVGSLSLVFLVAAVYLVVVLGLGLFLSTIAQTQQQAMFIAFFFMIVFVMMSGSFTSIENMPDWAQKLNLINPVAYFMRVIRMILLKGSGFKDILKDFCILCIYAFLTLSLAIRRYRKVT
jgi:ABC-2 type transport system permease protein